MTKTAPLSPTHPLLQQAQALYQAGQLAAAANLYRSLLHSYPKQLPLLTTLGTILLKMGQYADSIQILEQAIAIDPRQAQICLLLGICQMRLDNFAAALQRYDQAISLQADYADAYCNRGNALIKLQRLDEALTSFDKAIALKADFVLAHFNRGNLQRDLKNFAQAQSSYQRTLALKPDFAEAYSNLGSVLRNMQQIEPALRCYEQAIALRGNDAAFHFNRANVLQDLKRNAEALDSYALAIRYQPDLPEAHLKQGMLLNSLQQFNQALDSFAAAIALAPTDSQAYCQRGIALQELKRYPEALQSYDRAISLDPAYADAYCNRGITLQSLKRLEAALADFATALTLKPDYAQAYNNRGNALRILNHTEAALACYQQALAISPDFAEAYCNRGLALYELKRFDEALQSCEQALALKADFAQAYDNRGIILENLNRYPEALHSFELAMSLNPALDFIAGQCLSAKLMLCDWQQLDEQIHSLLSKLGNGLKVINPFVMLAVSDDAALQRKAAEIFVADNQLPAGELPALPYSGHPRIKIGYFSADFCQHPVALLSAGLYRLHDRSRFEVYGFSFTVKTDDITLELQNSFEHFYDIRQMSNQEVAALMLSLEIDIAVDLGGHTSNSRSSLFSKRIAPLQVSYLGYSGTLGGNYMDYLLADPVLIPQSSQPFYSETIACLPHSYMVNDNTRPISGTAISRPQFGLPEQGFVYCCFNNTYKLNPQLFDSWMRILASVTNSVLWLSAANATAMDNLRREAENRGIAAERLIFAQRLPLMADHLARLQLADLFLDTLPYNAHTTSSDALWAGLPVLTCQGESFAGRVAASLLTAIKLPELITDSPAAYEALAISLAEQPQTLAAIRTKLAANRLTTPLFDTALFTRDLEALYQRLYSHQQNGLPPAPIYP